MRIVSGVEPEWFEPEAAKEGDSSARFRLKPLDGHEKAQVIQCIDGDRVNAEGVKIAYMAAIIGWEGVTDANDEPLQFTKSRIGLLPPQVLLEIANRAINVSFLDEEDSKN